MPKGFLFPVSESYVVYIKGLSEFDEIESLPDRVKLAAQKAVSYATKRARTDASRRMREQIAWTASYLDDKVIMRTGYGDKMEGMVSTFFRPTSLARFASGSKTPWKYAKQLHVGAAKYASGNGKMLFVPLKAGSAVISEDKFNLGLAIRLKDGETVKGKYKMKPISKGLYLLYGPSSSQVFYTVAEDLIPDVSNWLDTEFERQLSRKDV